VVGEGDVLWAGRKGSPCAIVLSTDRITSACSGISGIAIGLCTPVEQILKKMKDQISSAVQFINSFFDFPFMVHLVQNALQRIVPPSQLSEVLSPL
jgi:hypothetical protein